MSGHSAATRKLAPSPEEIQRAAEAAEKKAQAIVEQIKKEQTWLDQTTRTMSEGEKDELFRQASAKCKETSMKDGNIVQACPMPKKLEYCVNADPFTCPNGKVRGGGCKPSKRVSEALRDDTTCIDADFIAKAEGGSYLSPYVPWGPISGSTKDGLPKLTQGNSSGVTIGTGVDLGSYTDKDAYLTRLEKAGVSAKTLETLKPLLGKKKEEACKALREAKQNGPLVLPPQDVELIDIDAMQARVRTLKSQYTKTYTDRIERLNNSIRLERESKTSIPNQAKINTLQQQINSSNEFCDLTCTQQSILFSTIYQEGNIFSRRTKTGAVLQPHKEAFLEALFNEDDEATRLALVAKSGNPNELIASRGKQELSYFDDGE